MEQDGLAQLIERFEEFELAEDSDDASDTDSEDWSEPDDSDSDTVSEPEEVEIQPPPWFRAPPIDENLPAALYGIGGGFGYSPPVELFWWQIESDLSDGDVSEDE